jgi:NRPS condensation-like uncharacterized protein
MSEAPQQDSDQWYRLDNAARIFATIASYRTTTVFRIAATCRDTVDSGSLQTALANIMPRFPYFQVELKKGLFWYYLQKTGSIFQVQEETESPCRIFSAKKDGKFLIRVLVFKKRISVEFSHILTDGTGGLVFLKALVGEYLRVKGIDTEESADIPRPGQAVPAEEWEDAYCKFYDPAIPSPKREEKAFHMPGPVTSRNFYRITTGVVPIQPLIARTKEFEVTVTELLTAVFMEAILEYLKSLSPRQQKRYGRPVRIMIPVDLRKLYPSRTMKNFFLTVTPGIDPRLGEYTFEEILKSVFHYMRVEVNEKYINRQLKRNVHLERHPLLRTVPLLLKIPMERLLYYRYSSSLQSALLSNLGKVEIPSDMAEHIERFDVIPNPRTDTKIGCSVMSYADSCCITFGSILEHTDIEKHFFRKLRQMDIIPKIETN